MFDRIAPVYDLMNRVMTAGLDRRWRQITVEQVVRPGDRVLDACCGTGDLAFALARQGSAAQITGADFSHQMLAIARAKAAAAKSSGATSETAKSRVEFVEADALRLPFADATFDLVTTAFGFRNLANYDLGLKEVLRVLRPDGELGILEFSEPRGKLPSVVSSTERPKSWKSSCSRRRTSSSAASTSASA